MARYQPCVVRGKEQRHRGDIVGDEAALGLAVELAGPNPDGLTRLVAGMIVLTWRTAYDEAIRVFDRGGSAKKANAAFIALIDRGFAAVHGMAARSSSPPRA